MNSAAGMEPRFALDEAARTLGAELKLPSGMSQAPGFAGASIDSRTLVPGQLFAPLPGERADGHSFLEIAFARGAAAALCVRGHAREWAGREPGPLLVVDDVTRGLQELASAWRTRWDGLLIGVTGSAGKTTTKNLVALALATRWSTHATAGNLNNHWGVPLTLLALSPAHRAAVVEMGMNRPGEIAMLADLAKPGAAVITNAGAAHLERFGSVEAVAREKASLGLAVPPSGVVFAGADSPPLLAALAGAGRRIVTYGLTAAADLRPRAVEDLGPRGSRLEVLGFPAFRLPLIGRHHVANALAALAVAREWQLDPQAVVAALEHASPGPGRMEVRDVGGATLLLDHYNANPESTRAALATLASWPGATRRIAVLGDMLELGDAAPELHRATGAAARGVEVWTVGSFADDIAAGARDAGHSARVFADKHSLAEALRPSLGPGVAVLLKASRGAALEDVLSELGTHSHGSGA